MNKFFIKKDAIRKAGQIFGFDINELENSLKYQKDKNEKEQNSSKSSSSTLTEENSLLSRPKVSLKEEKNDNKNVKKEEQKETDKNVKKYGYTAMYSSSVVSVSTSLPRFFFAAGGIALFAVSITFSFIGSAIGAGVGYYLMKRHCEDILDQFELLFIQNADQISNSLVFGINYLKNMAEYYKKLGC